MSQAEHYTQPEILVADPAPALGTALQAEEFERVEDKFLVPMQYRDELLELLYRKSRPSYLTSDTHFLGIESVYYESPEFQSYRDHFLAKPYRFKLRTRRYAANGVHDTDETHIELKTKDGETSRKFRFRLADSDLSRLKEYLPIRVSGALVEMNETIPGEELSRRARHISRLVAEHRLSPVCRVHYKRMAFERRGVRVTVDTDIRSQLLRPIFASEIFEGPAQVRENARAMADRFQAAPHALLEVKHRGMIPRWLENFTVLRTAGKAGFSKYCFSLTRHLMEQGKA